MIGKTVAGTIVAMAVAVLTESGAVADPGWRPPAVSVDGAVATPMTYSTGELRALPQTTFSLPRHGWHGSHTADYAGVAVEDLVTAAGPELPDAKNALLRVTVTAPTRGRWPRSTISRWRCRARPRPCRRLRAR